MEMSNASTDRQSAPGLACKGYRAQETEIKRLQGELDTLRDASGCPPQAGLKGWCGFLYKQFSELTEEPDERELEAGPELEAPPERPFVLLEWWDSRLAASWLDHEVDLSPAVCRSAGWIMSENEEYLAIAGTWSPTINEFAAVIVIPVACIQKRIGLTWPAKEK